MQPYWRIRDNFEKMGKSPFFVHPQWLATRVKFSNDDHIAIIAALLAVIMEDYDGSESIARKTRR